MREGQAKGKWLAKESRVAVVVTGMCHTAMPDLTLALGFTRTYQALSVILLTATLVSLFLPKYSALPLPW
jgi:hypothetical protein